MKNIILDGVEYMPVPTNEIAKDYEILSFITTNINKILFTLNEGYYKSPEESDSRQYDLQYFLSLERSFTIDSFKRLSDEEIFTRADEFKINGRDEIFKIFKIEIIQGNVRVRDYNNFGYLESITKVKPPTIILTTEDGVEITNGEQIIWIVSNNFKTGHNHVKDCNLDSFFLKYFSTLEARDEYVFQNKPITTTYKEFKDRPSSPTEFFKSKQK